MTNTECTTAAPESATTPRSKSRVNHLFWERDGEIAEELGVQIRYLCGLWSKRPPHDLQTIEVTLDDRGDSFSVRVKHRTMTCGNCARIHRAYVDREIRKGRMPW